MLMQRQQQEPAVHRISLLLGLACLCLVSTACSSKIKPSTGHIGLERAAQPVAAIPPPVTQTPVVPPPKPQQKQETYTVIVNQVPVKDLLFALARDAQLNLDVYDDIQGLVTINAIDQTLPQILDRISRQSAIRYQIKDDSLIVGADTPYLQTYTVPYMNMKRDSMGQVSMSTQIASGGTIDVQGGGSRSGGGNNSTLSVTNSSAYDFWRTLFINIKSIIGDKVVSAGQDLSSDNVSVNRETGFISVRATSKQHAEVQEFIDQVVGSAQRQVLIEATVVEINLNDTFNAGIDWSRIATNPADGTTIRQNLLGLVPNATTPGMVLGYSDPRGDYNVTATLRLLREFGNVSVLSSPKLMVLNNQTSVLKVVDNRVYFTVDVTVTPSAGLADPLTAFETEIHTVPVGLVMSLMPYISDTDEIILNIRPTISRILQFVNDPNPDLADAGVESPIPEIQVREMESVLRLTDGQVAVIGGLMQNSTDKNTTAVPGLSSIPLIGEAFKSRNNEVNKTELVIFLRTTIIRKPSLEGDLSRFKEYLPTGK
jgi:MSHA type pilus biogenesis protein MshL